MHVLKKALALLCWLGACWLLLNTVSRVIVQANDQWEYEERQGEVCVLVYCNGMLESEDCVPYRLPF